MLGDKKQAQRQNQQALQNVQVGGEGTVRIPCPHYTDAYVEAIEMQLKEMIANISQMMGGASDISHVNDALKKSQEISVLSDHGRVAAIMCSLLDEDRYTCRSPKHDGKRCLLRGPKPASAVRVSNRDYRPDLD